jgi:hypothetical protein
MSQMSRKLNSISRTLHYICRGPWFEPLSSHLSTLRVKFLATRLFDKKKNGSDNKRKKGNDNCTPYLLLLPYKCFQLSSVITPKSLVTNKRSLKEKIIFLKSIPSANVILDMRMILCFVKMKLITN